MKKEQLQKQIDLFTRLLGYNLKCVRIHRGLDLPAVSAALGLSVRMLDRIEQGKNPHITILFLYELAKLYKTGVYNFFIGVK